MDLLNLFTTKNISNFSDIQTLLTNDSYSLVIKEDENFPNLYMVTYDRNTEKLDNSVIRTCRGIILEKDTNKIICYTFDKIPDADLSDKNCPIDWDSTTIEEALDGTQIRIFYYNEEWMVASTRCIDAHRARWFSKRNFYELFKDVDDIIDYDSLDRKCCYSFVLQHPENRIVVPYEKSGLVHVLTRNLETLEEIEVDIGVPKPSKVKFDKYEDLLEEA